MTPQYIYNGLYQTLWELSLVQKRLILEKNTEPKAIFHTCTLPNARYSGFGNGGRQTDDNRRSGHYNAITCSTEPKSPDEPTMWPQKRKSLILYTDVNKKSLSLYLQYLSDVIQNEQPRMAYLSKCWARLENGLNLIFR